MTKYLLSLLIGIIFTGSVSAQFYKNVLPTGEFSESLGKIVLDYRNNFKNVKGTEVPKEVGIDMFESTVKLPGSVENYITISHSVKDRRASFQAIMYQGEDYDQAVKVYKNVYKLVRKTRVRWLDKSLANFYGKMEPATGLNFTVSNLKVEISDPRYIDFLTEIELVNSNFSNWEVRINILRRKLDSEILPDN